MTRKRLHKELPPLVQECEAIPSPAPGLSIEARGGLILAAALISACSALSFAYTPDTANWLGALGHIIGKFWFSLLGLGTYPYCALAVWVGWRKLFHKPVNHLRARIIYVTLCVVAMDLILCIGEETLPALNDWLGETLLTQMWHKRLRYHLGGAPLFFIYRDLPSYNLLRLFNALGVGLMALAMLGCGLLYLCKSSPRVLLKNLVRLYRDYSKRLILWWQGPLPMSPSSLPQRPVPMVAAPPAVAAKAPQLPLSTLTDERPTLPTQRRTKYMLEALSSASKENLTTNGSDESLFASNSDTDEMSDEMPTHEEFSDFISKPIASSFSNYILPSLDLLTPAKPIDNEELIAELRVQAEVLEETLLNFGIVAKVGNINCGPTITSFEVHPAVGVKVQRIKALGNDIALNLEAKSIRIIAPIPGKAAVGIEVPNPDPQEVSFHELQAAYQAGNKRFHIPLLLGKAVNGDMVMNDLAKMPHLIIAGATGSGKSVCINTIVMSIVLNTKPDEVKLVMVDPKKVELTPYSRMPHMLAPVITESQGASAVLQWLVKEMESRYELLKLIGLRNIEAFNHRTRDLEKEESLDRDVPARLHYIVGIIDELADLMMVASNDIETFIARIAQMARAVGIHLILATQRPSREVITGLIKANFPARISFKVASRVNSQIILDEIGAETLLGNGDMLFLPPGTSQLMRAQGAYIRDEDINRVIEHICSQAPPRYVIQSFDNMHDDSEEDDDLPINGDDLPADLLFARAKDIIISTGNASTTFLQRKLKVGYPRAASLMDQLEQYGVVGPLQGSRPRKILMGRDGALTKASLKDEEEDFDILDIDDLGSDLCG